MYSSVLVVEMDVVDFFGCDDQKVRTHRFVSTRITCSFVVEC